MVTQEKIIGWILIACGVMLEASAVVVFFQHRFVDALSPALVGAVGLYGGYKWLKE